MFNHSTVRRMTIDGTPVTRRNTESLPPHDGGLGFVLGSFRFVS